MYSGAVDTPDYTWLWSFSCYFLHFRIPVVERKLPPPVFLGVSTVGVVGVEETKTHGVLVKKAALFREKRRFRKITPRVLPNTHGVFPDTHGEIFLKWRFFPKKCRVFGCYDGGGIFRTRSGILKCRK